MDPTARESVSLSPTRLDTDKLYPTPVSTRVLLSVLRRPEALKQQSTAVARDSKRGPVFAGLGQLVLGPREPVPRRLPDTDCHRPFGHVPDPSTPRVAAGPLKTPRAQ